jgi:hypothetical protein
VEALAQRAQAEAVATRNALDLRATAESNAQAHDERMGQAQLFAVGFAVAALATVAVAVLVLLVAEERRRRETHAAQLAQIAQGVAGSESAIGARAQVIDAESAPCDGVQDDGAQYDGAQGRAPDTVLVDVDDEERAVEAWAQVLGAQPA